MRHGQFSERTVGNTQCAFQCNNGQIRKVYEHAALPNCGTDEVLTGDGRGGFNCFRNCSRSRESCGSGNVDVSMRHGQFSERTVGDTQCAFQCNNGQIRKVYEHSTSAGESCRAQTKRCVIQGSNFNVPFPRLEHGQVHSKHVSGTNNNYCMAQCWNGELNVTATAD